MQSFLSALKFDKKKFASLLVFLFIIYFLAIIGIIRTNFNYVDDIRRNIDGNSLTGDFSRYISTFLSYFLHAGRRLTDISPLPQLIACLILSLTGIVLVKVISSKTDKLLLLVTLPIGLIPYFLSCLSYKYDAPYMALSILASVFPFLFRQQNRWLFALVCVAATLVMTMTYQASSGIFIMMTLYLFFTNLLYKKESLKNNFTFLGIALGSYCVALLMFKLLFLANVNSYVSSDITKIGSMISVSLQNFKRYFMEMNYDFNIKWKILSMVIIAIFYVKTIVFSKINKIASICLTSIFLLLLVASIFGVYLLLDNPLFSPRAMYAVGFFLAILCVDIAFSLKKIFSLPSILLIWCFFVFSFSYGNALADQKRYDDFRTQLLVSDLSSLLPDRTEEPYAITIVHNIGFSPVVENVAVDNRVIKNMVHLNLKEGCPFMYMYLFDYHKFNLQRGSDIVDETLPVVFDSYYHTIKMADKKIVAILK